MGKVSEEEKKKYNESIKDFKEKIETSMRKIALLEKDIKSKSDDFGNYRRILAANEYLTVIGLYINMSDASMERLNIKNENFLEQARKYIYRVLILLEEVVTPHIDVPFSDIEDRLATVVKLNPKRKLNLLRKIGYHISLIKEGFGENSKWKWSFVEIEGRYATIIKNIVDYRECQANNDPRKPYYVELNELMRLVKEQLKLAGSRYKDKYELKTREPGDIKKAIDLTNALRRVCIVFNDPEEAQNLKRTAELYHKQMEENMKKQDKEKGRSRAAARG